MPFRVTDSSTAASTAAKVNAQRSRLSVLQDRLISGKRINRPSDDPTGAEAVIRLRTSQAEIEAYKRNTGTAEQKLTVTDDVISSYELILDRVKSLVSRGASDTTTQDARNALAAEIDVLRERVLNIANSRNGDEYLFGGTRQNAPPFDPATAAPAATPATPQHVGIEPGANAVATGITAETVFSDATATIFDDLTAASAALRGTGDPVADKATITNSLQRLEVYSDLTDMAHARIGANMKNVELVRDRLASDFLSFETQASDIESADFVETATQFAETQRALDALLQIKGREQRSLLDFLG